MDTALAVVLETEPLSESREVVIDCTSVSTMGVQAVYAPVADGQGILSSSISIDGLHYTSFPVEPLFIDSADTSIWAFRDPFYNFVKFMYTPIRGSVFLSLMKLIRDKSIVRS